MAKKAAADVEQSASNRCPCHWWRAYALRSAVDGSDSAAAKDAPEADRKPGSAAKPARGAAGKS
jgi:hypothetical protein